MKSKDKNLTNFFGKFCKILSYIFLVFLVIICSFFIFYILESVYAKVTNKKPLLSMYVIVSPSMVPTINVYDMIIDTGVRSDSNIKKGDIITFYSSVIDTGGYTITHRIYSLTSEDDGNRYVTKGDNNSSVDVGYTVLKNIVGKVFVIIPKIGYIQKFLTSKWGWLLVILIPTFGILLSDIIKLIGLFKIKNEIVDIPDLGNLLHEQEIESNKKLRVLIEKSEKLENEKEDNNEEGASTK